MQKRVDGRRDMDEREKTLRDDHWMKKSILDLVKEFMADKIPQTITETPAIHFSVFLKYLPV